MIKFVYEPAGTRKLTGVWPGENGQQADKAA